MRTSLDGSIEIDAPARTTWELWHRLDLLARCLDAVERVEAIDAQHSHWRVRVGFGSEEWDAEITDDAAAGRSSWRSVAGAANAGVVNFHELSDRTTLLTLHIDYEPHGFLQVVADEIGVVGRVVGRALVQFKELVENAA